MRALWLAVLIPAALTALTPQSDSVTGTVRNAITGEPIKGAVVTLFKAPDPTERPSKPEVHSSVSSSGGEFNFTALGSGRYSVSAQKQGYLLASAVSAEDELNAITLPSSGKSFTIKLTPLGVIEGTVVNQYGDPMRGVTISVLRSFIADGERNVRRPSPDKITNDLGQFRFYDLPPGKYYVKAMNRAGGTAAYVGENAVRFDAWEGFRPVYFGGARLMDSATPVTIEPGTQARADFKLVVEPTYKVRGSLENFTAHQAVVFELLQEDDIVAPSRVSLNGNTGRFEIDDVAAGQYTLRVTQAGVSRGELILELNGGDVEGVSVSLVPAVEVKGTVRVDGPAAEESGTPAPFTNRRHTRSICNLSLRSGREDNRMEGQLSGVGPDILIPNVFPGRYETRIQCFGGYVQSAVAGGRDLLAEPTLTIAPGAALPPIEITMKRGGGAVNAELAAPPPAVQAMLLLVPTLRATGPVVAAGLGDVDGHVNFSAANLAPGDYLAYAIDDIDRLEYRNPVALRNLAGGVSVRVEENKTTEITLSGWAK